MSKYVNPLFLTDFYKVGHIDQYPEGTEIIYSNLTPRFSKYSNVPLDGVIVAGIRQFCKFFLVDYWNEHFFSRPKKEVVDEYAQLVGVALNNHTIRVDHIEYLHDLQKLPLVIEGLLEGSFVPHGVPVLRVVNTDQKCFWLTNYLETVMSCELWKPMTTATTAAYYRKVLDSFCKDTNPEASDFVDFQAHDFSFRGMSGYEDAATNGMSHLMLFKGTDTIASISRVTKTYGDTGFIGGSVNATEHSVMCAGSKELEYDTYERLITKVYPEGIVSIVSDTWDYWGILTNTLPQLKDKILARNGKLVIRPDSGDPVKVICGDLEANPESPEYKGSIEVLWDLFGGTISSTGYKVLDEHIGLIYGDAITPQRMWQIVNILKDKGFASTNVVFGVGSYTYNMNSRDTHGFAVKATWAQIKGEPVDLFKQPKTDPSKNSAKGKFSVVWDSVQHKYVLSTDISVAKDSMYVYFSEGALMVNESFSDISTRARAFSETLPLVAPK